MYEFSSRVRYSEVDAEGKLKWSALVNYLQDCSTFQSEDVGVGVQYLYAQGMAWVLNYWQIDLKRLPKLAENIIIGTIPYEIKGFMGLRNFYIKDAKTGEMIVKANSVWTLIDIEKVRPVRATKEMIEGYVTGERVDMEYTDRKITLEGEERTEEPIVVSRFMLDTNNHVNNEQYIELALSYLPENKTVKRLRTEYKKSAYLGDVLIPIVTEGEGSVGVSFVKEGDTEPCVKCQFVF